MAGPHDSHPGTPCAACTRTTAAWSRWLPELVRAHRGRLAAVARAEGLVGEEVLDVVQEAFAAFVARAGAVGTTGAADGLADGPGATEGPPAGARGTLVALTRNLARNRRRLHHLARPHVSDGALDALSTGDTPESRLLAAEDHARLACCVARLADVQRAVVTLRMLEDVPGHDVAVQLGISPGHVAVLLHRARAALATCLSEDT